MKPKLKFARVRIAWYKWEIPCCECEFEKLNGSEHVCSTCLKLRRNGEYWHPVIVPVPIIDFNLPDD